jgi:hypothetical protein
MKTLKERVLDRCRELEETPLSRIEGKIVAREMTSGGYDIYEMGGKQRGRLWMHVNSEMPETDFVWPLAAQVLGIGEGNTPTNELIYRAIVWGAKELQHSHIDLVKIDNWLKAQPKDPQSDQLEKDRELVRLGFPYLETALKEEGARKEYIAAIRRLCGLEVKNG